MYGQLSTATNMINLTTVIRVTVWDLSRMASTSAELLTRMAIPSEREIPDHHVQLSQTGVNYLAYIEDHEKFLNLRDIFQITKSIVALVGIPYRPRRD